MSTEDYVNHHLNASKTKESHQFSKANRFPKSSRMYQETYIEPLKLYTPCHPPPASAPLPSDTGRRWIWLITPHPLRLAPIMLLANSRKDNCIILPAFIREGKRSPSVPSYSTPSREIRKFPVLINTTSPMSTDQWEAGWGKGSRLTLMPRKRRPFLVLEPTSSLQFRSETGVHMSYQL
jgi:hypothetical protein